MSSTTPRQTYILRSGWCFKRGDVPGGESPDLDDDYWEEVSVPHDWSIEGPFKQFRDENWHLTNLDHRIGYLPQGIGWYRFHLHVPKDWLDKHVEIQFDGVYRESKTWINGHLLGFRPYGYSSFHYDLTPHLKAGDNVIAVRVDNTGVSSRWYAGSGIYRKVFVTVTGRHRVAWWGTRVTTGPRPSWPGTPGSREQLDLGRETPDGTVRVETRIESDVAVTNGKVRTEIFDMDGVVVASVENNVEFPAGEVILSQELFVDNPRPWSPDSPYLYDVKTTVLVGENKTDEYHTPLGFRTFRFDPDKGFFLNGNSLKIKGVCLHHDNGPLGARAIPRAIERKVEIMKSMGCNAIRTSHNPPSIELLDACDRLGMLVMDEAFDEWTVPKTPMGYTRFFDEPVGDGSGMRWHERDLVDFIHRDRNHPCVIIWSCGNEVPEQHSRYGTRGVEVLRKLLDIFHREDPTRPVTQGCNQMAEANKTGFADMLDIVGYNYYGDRVLTVSEEKGFKCQYDWEHEHYPKRAMIGSENCSAFNSRGVYEFPIPMARWQKKVASYHATSYDITSEIPLIILKTRPHVSGYFSWTGFDYIGEPTPYPWPSRSSYFGIVDLCGFPKDTYYLHKMMWVDGEPMVHLVPSSWNFPAGTSVEVWAYSNCDEVELFLNGKSLGTRRTDEYDDLAHVFWDDVTFEPGELKAIARTGGEVLATDIVRTAGPVESLELSADRLKVHADPWDLVYLTVRALDGNGNFAATATNHVIFTVDGPGRIVGVGNGDPTSHEPFTDQQRHLFSGMALAILQPTGRPGTITVRATSPMVKGATLTLEATKTTKVPGLKFL